MAKCLSVDIAAFGRVGAEAKLNSVRSLKNDPDVDRFHPFPDGNIPNQTIAIVKHNYLFSADRRTTPPA